MIGGRTRAGRAILRLAPWLVPATALAVYLTTMPPELTWRNSGADGGDLVTAAFFAGVPHPTGYPTWTILSFAMTKLPLGTVAWRVTLFSALAGAVAAAILYRIVLRVSSALPASRAALAAGVGAFGLAFSRLAWSQSVIAEVYALHLLFVALVLWLVLRWRDGDGSLPLAALVFGTGLGNHVTISFLAPSVAVLLWAGRRRLGVRPLLLSAGALLLGLGVYLYVPLRAATDPIVNWGGADTLPGFRWLVSGEGYRRFLFSVPLGDLPGKLRDLAWEVWIQFPVPAWPLVPIGLISLFRRRPALATAGAIHVAIVAVHATGYGVTDAYVYLLPAYLHVAVWIGVGAAAVLAFAASARLPERWRGRAAAAVVAGLLALPALSVWESYGFVDASGDREPEVYAEETLGAVAPGALFFAGSDAHTFTLWYYRYVRGMRPDVTVVNPSLLGFDWYRRTLAVHHPDLNLSPSMRVMILWYRGRRPIYLAEEPEGLGGIATKVDGRMWRVAPE